MFTISYSPALLDISLSKGHKTVIKYLLANYFNSVAQRDFNWLLDLKDIGFEAADVTSLLLETAKTVRWIRLPDITVSPSEVIINFHQVCCAHKQNSTEARKSLFFRPAAFQIERESMQRVVTGSCGLGRVFPPSLNQINNYGSVSFTRTKARVLFGDSGESEVGDTFDAESSIIDTVSRFSSRVEKHANRYIQTSFKDSTYYSQFLQSSTPSITEGEGVFQPRSHGLIRDQVGTTLPNTSQAKLVGQLHRALHGLNYALSELQREDFTMTDIISSQCPQRVRTLHSGFQS